MQNDCSVRSLYTTLDALSSTYVHSCLRTLDPVRSPHVKQANARLVVAWVTSSESRVLYVLRFLRLESSSGLMDYSSVLLEKLLL